MFAKSLVASVVLAAACVLSTNAAHAQSNLYPYSWYPTATYAPANCPNGNCAVARTGYYTPAYNNYAPSYANCPNGNCNVGVCANGRCAPVSCANGVCNGSARPTNYVPVSPVYPSYYRAPVTTNPAWPTTNYRPSGYAVPTTRMFNSANSPFYP